MWLSVDFLAECGGDEETTGAGTASKTDRRLDVLRAVYIAHSFLLFFTTALNDGFEFYLPNFHFQDLVKDLNSELSGDFRKLVMITLKTPAELDASELHSAIKVHS